MRYTKFEEKDFESLKNIFGDRIAGLLGKLNQHNEDYANFPLALEVVEQPEGWAASVAFQKDGKCFIRGAAFRGELSEEKEFELFKLIVAFEFGLEAARVAKGL